MAPSPPFVPFHGYTVFTEWPDWGSALASCQSKGGTLARITSEGEQEELAALLNFTFEQGYASCGPGYDFSRCAWLGASDAAKEGVWSWSVGGTTADESYQPWRDLSGTEGEKE